MEPMPFRRNAGLERLEWSGCKAGESVTGASGTVPILGAAKRCKWRRSDAGNCLHCRHAQAASLGVILAGGACTVPAVAKPRGL